jgi:hypothetical protein
MVDAVPVAHPVGFLVVLFGCEADGLSFRMPALDEAFEPLS